MPIRWKRGTEEDLAKLPALIISFGPRLTPEQILAENDRDDHEDVVDVRDSSGNTDEEHF